MSDTGPSTVRQITAALRETVVIAVEIRGMLQQRINAAIPQIQAIVVITRGSHHRMPHEAIARLRTYVDEMLKASEWLNLTITELNAYLAFPFGEPPVPTGSPTTTPSLKIPTRQPRTWDRPTPHPNTWQPPLPGFAPAKTYDAAKDRITAKKNQVNAAGNTRAHADVYTAHGRRINRDYVIARNPNRVAPAYDLKPPWRDDKRYTTTWHAERQLAQHIRDAVAAGYRGPFAIYINIPLCGGPRQGSSWLDPMKCHINFQHLIPLGVSAWVHIVSDGKPKSPYRIDGTGEGIA